MVCHERDRVCCTEHTVYDHGKWNPQLVNRFAKGDSLLDRIRYAVVQAGVDQEKCQAKNGSNKCEKVAVVASTNTIVEPDAMVIKRFHAVVTDSAVIAARRPPDVAGFAIFDRQVHCGSVRSCRSNRNPVAHGRTKSQWIRLRIWWRMRIDIAWQDLRSSASIL